MHVCRRLLPAVLIALSLALGGCAGMQRKPPPSLEEVIQMSRDGMPAQEIIDRLRETRAVYPLSGSRLAQLRDEGVSDEVLDYLQQAYIDRIRWQERVYYHDPFWASGCIGCYYYYRPWAAPYFVIPR
jgi:hypothetical protein